MRKGKKYEFLNNLPESEEKNISNPLFKTLMDKKAANC